MPVEDLKAKIIALIADQDATVENLSAFRAVLLELADEVEDAIAAAGDEVDEHEDEDELEEAA